VLSWLYAIAALLGRIPWLHRLRDAHVFLPWRERPPGYRRTGPPTQAFRHSPAKPGWVRKEVLRLKALMPHATCRDIAHCFNRRFEARRKMRVGKTFVWEWIRKHRYEIEVLRRRIKSARPRPVPQNLIWGLDLTGKASLDAKTHLVLGILEHASRAALWLEALPNKSSWTLIVTLLAAIKRHGRPRIVRTDNESVFVSRTFRLALLLLGIRHQRTDPGCPWQNGRIERFFGTLKDKLDRLAVESLQTLNLALGEFRFFYNHVRPHQNLGGATPAEAWAGVDPYASRIKREYWFEGWDGLLAGYYLRR
jgi:putative transposase